MDALYYNGFKLAYRRYGASDAPAVVLIMGLGMSSAAWPTSLIAHLVREGFQVITPDNRDCGESSRCTDMKADGRNVASAVAQALLRRKVTSAYALEDMALDVERLLNHLSIRRAHIVGISMGGMIAQVAAVQSPNRVASLTSIASASGNPRTGFGRLNAVWTLLRKPDNLNTEEGLRDYFARVFTTLSGPAYKPSGEELESMLGMLGSLHYDPDGTARQLLGMLGSLHYDPDGTARQLLAILASGDRSWQLRRLAAPSLIIHGTADPLLPLAAGRETADLIPNARFEVIEGMGHQLPEALVPELGALIAEHCHRHPA